MRQRVIHEANIFCDEENVSPIACAAVVYWVSQTPRPPKRKLTVSIKAKAIVVNVPAGNQMSWRNLPKMFLVVGFAHVGTDRSYSSLRLSFLRYVLYLSELEVAGKM